MTTESVEDQFQKYLENYKKLVFKISNAYCSDVDDRKDLIQEIILHLWQSYSRYDGSSSLSTWTYQIAINVSISYLRKVKSRDKKLQQYRHEIEFQNLDEVSIEDDLKHLYHFINLLKPVDKGIIVLYLEGCKTREIAKVMGLSETNIATKKHRITGELKKYFEAIK